MLWPDVTRRIWSYIIAKLGIFTNVDPSQLELSATKLRLNQLEVDHSKLEIPGMTTQKFVIDQLELELGVSGLFISANSVSVELMLDKIESADLGISMLMEATKNEINSEIPEENGVAGGIVAASDGAIVGPAGAVSGSSAVGGVASKIADIALSQISATVKEINIDVHMSHQSSIGIHIEQGILSSKHKLELESISINYSEADQMMKSVYFDTSSTLMSVPDLAFINRIVVDFMLDSMTFSVLVDHARVAGVSLLKWIVTLMNEQSGQGNDNRSTEDSTDTSNEASGDLTVGTLEVYETLEGSKPPLKLHNIKLTQLEFSIEELELPEVVHISPFFSLNRQKTESGEVILQASIDVPVSSNIPLDYLSSMHQLIDTISTILADLDFEDDREATKFIMKLPELRIGIENGLAVLLVFPQNLSQEHLSIRECVLTADDGQILLKNLDFDFGSKVDIDEIRLKITQKFLERITSMKNEYDKFIPDSELDKSFVDEVVWNGIELPQLSFKVQRLLFDYENYQLSLFVHCMMSSETTSLKVEASGSLDKSEAEVEFQAISRDGLRTVDSALLFKKCNIDIPSDFHNIATADSSNDASSKEKSGSESSSPALFPATNCGIKFDTEINIFANDVQSRLSFDNSCFSIDPNQTTLVIPRAMWGVLDTNFVNLLKVKNLKYKFNPEREHSISIKKCVLSTCADTHHYIVDTISKLVPDVPTPSFKTELESEINVFDGVEKEYFVSDNFDMFDKEQRPLKEDNSAAPVTKSMGSLDIHDNYMSADAKDRHVVEALPLDSAGKAIPSTTLRLAANHMFAVKMKQFQWQVFDGYDFENSRVQAAEIANTPKPSKSKSKQGKDSQNVAENIGYNEEDEIESDDEDYEDEDMRTTHNKLEDSMFITPQVKPSKRTAKLSKKRHKEPLVPDNFTRSSKAYILLTIWKTKFASTDNKTVSLVIRDGIVNDQVPVSKITELIAPLHPEFAKSVGGKELVSFTQSLTGSDSTPEKRVKLNISPLKLSIDQDTAEFIGAFFSFGQEKDSSEKAELGKENTSVFIQSMEFSGLQLLIDYIPKKLDYKSLRSGTTTELLNVFTVKGARLNLKSAVVYGLTGWDQVFDQLLDLWTPDIKATQLAGLVAGIAPIRKALKVTKEVRKYAVRPVSHTVVAQGAGALMRRAFGELLKMGQSWLEYSDQALGGPE